MNHYLSTIDLSSFEPTGEAIPSELSQLLFDQISLREIPVIDLLDDTDINQQLAGKKRTYQISENNSVSCINQLTIDVSQYSLAILVHQQTS